MGLSIQYKGRFKEDTRLQDMIEEVVDIVSIYQWKYQVYQTVFPSKSEVPDKKIYGISFSPPDCETLSLCFLSDLNLCDPVYLQYGAPIPAGTSYLHSVKTQFTGLDRHITIISILKYISGKYLDSFELTDESGFWDTGNKTIAAQKFDDHHRFLNVTADTVKDLILQDGETFEAYAKRLAQHVEKILKKK